MKKTEKLFSCTDLLSVFTLLFMLVISMLKEAGAKGTLHIWGRVDYAQIIATSQFRVVVRLWLVTAETLECWYYGYSVL